MLPLPLGVSTYGEDREFLVASQAPSRPGSQIGIAFARDFRIAGTRPPRQLQAMLELGQGRSQGQARASWMDEKGRFQPIDEMVIVGPGMPRIPLVGANAIAVSTAGWKIDENRWSRTAGALGTRHWQRLTELRYLIIGAGRSGSLLASMLVRAGVRQIDCVDPDLLESSNLGESVGFTSAGIGEFKVFELAKFLRSQAEVAITPVPHSVSHVKALQAVMRSDIVCVTVDHDSARLAAACLAALFHRPCLDIGTGITNEDGRRQMGADVRFTWSGRCLLCTGGLRDFRAAQQVLSSPDAEQSAREGLRDWQVQRAGSLASLNALAVSAAIRMIEDFVSGRLRQNGSWLRFEYDEAGRLSTTYPPVTPNGHSGAVCVCRFSGRGQDGLADVAQAIRQVRVGRSP